MKLVPQKGLPVFQPINLILTIESTEELRHLKTFAGQNISIPDAIARAYTGAAQTERVNFAIAFLKVLQGAVEQIYNPEGEQNGNTTS